MLEVRDLRVKFPTDDGVVHAVDGVSASTVGANETLGIVGESGSGKSVTSLAILGLLPKSAKVTGERSCSTGASCIGLERAASCSSSAATTIAMIFQDALAALNPVFKVGDQIAEAITVHHDSIGRGALHERVIELLDIVGIPNPTRAPSSTRTSSPAACASGR